MRLIIVACVSVLAACSSATEGAGAGGPDAAPVDDPAINAADVDTSCRAVWSANAWTLTQATVKPLDFVGPRCSGRYVPPVPTVTGKLTDEGWTQTEADGSPVLWSAKTSREGAVCVLTLERSRGDVAMTLRASLNPEAPTVSSIYGETIVLGATHPCEAGRYSSRFARMP